MSKPTPIHPIDALRAREGAIRVRLAQLDALTWTAFDEAKHREAIATARADLARGLIDEAALNLLIAARDDALAAFQAETAGRAEAEQERLDLNEELNSVREALTEELTARAHRRRAEARARFADLADQFRQMIEGAHALLPALVAAGVHAADELNDTPSPMARLVRDLDFPVFALEPDGRQTITRLVFDPKRAEAAIDTLGAQLEAIA